MIELAQKKCKPCEAGQQPFKGADLSKLFSQLKGWELIEERQLRKTYRFPNFVEALEFVNRIGELAEEEGHHPDIFLTWGKVRVELWTHKINGLSENDFIMAAKFDEANLA
jgi:4a-hydroxytetrahydrobiopterin dehydratase